MATEQKKTTKSAKRKRLRRRQSVKRGLPPGTLVSTSHEDKQGTSVYISIIEYDAQTLQEIPDARIDQISREATSSQIKWVDVVGVHDVEVVQRIGELFDIHPLILEDVVNIEHRPKIEEYDRHLFAVLKMLRHKDEAEDPLIAEHISMVLGDRFVITFQEEAGDVFDSVRNRLRDGRSRIRSSQADYLLYALMDAIVDHYFLVVENIEDRIEEIDDALFENPSSALLDQINTLRKETLFVRRHIRPLRDVFLPLLRADHTLIQPATQIYLRDVYDHVLNVTDTVENFRDTIGAQVDHYLSTLSNRMNEVMKFLTVIGSVFIPLTFIAGVYGMNFEHMPELHWPMGYPLVMGIMLAIGLATYLYFRSKT